MGQNFIFVKFHVDFPALLLFVSDGDNVPGILDMVGQENNSSQFGFLYMIGQGLSREKAFVPGPATMMIF